MNQEDQALLDEGVLFVLANGVDKWGRGLRPREIRDVLGGRASAFDMWPHPVPRIPKCLRGIKFTDMRKHIYASLRRLKDRDEVECKGHAPDYNFRYKVRSALERLAHAAD